MSSICIFWLWTWRQRTAVRTGAFSAGCGKDSSRHTDQGCCGFFFVRWRGRQALGCVPLREGGAVCWAQRWGCLGISSFSLRFSSCRFYCVMYYSWLTLGGGGLYKVSIITAVSRSGHVDTEGGWTFCERWPNIYFLYAHLTHVVRSLTAKRLATVMYFGQTAFSLFSVIRLL